MDAHNWIELWKAIHGGCWPGPPPDNRLNELTRDVIAGLALHNLSHAFGESPVAKQVRGVAVDSLSKSLPALQRGLQG